MEGLIFMDLVLGDGKFHDVSAADISTMNINELMELLRLTRERLREICGGSGDIHETSHPHTYVQSARAPRRLHITRTYRIYLEGRHEIRLKPLCKTVFILYLKHPEGIEFKNLPLHRRELCDIYARVSRRSNMESVTRSIDRLIDLSSNNISTHRSQLVRQLSTQIEREILPHYLLEGKPGHTRKIPLDRNLIEWEL